MDILNKIKKPFTKKEDAADQNEPKEEFAISEDEQVVFQTILKRLEEMSEEQKKNILTLDGKINEVQTKVEQKNYDDDISKLKEEIAKVRKSLDDFYDIYETICDQYNPFKKETSSKDSDAKEPGSASSKNDDSSNSQKEMVPKSSESSVSKEQSKSDNSTIVKETVVSEDQKESSDYDLSSSKSGIKDKIVPSESTALSLGSGHLYDKYLKKLDSLNLKMWPIFVHSILDKEKNSDLLRKSVASSDALKKFDKDIVSLKDLLLVLPKPSNEFDMDIISWVKVLDADLYDSVKSASDKKEFLAYALASL